MVFVFMSLPPGIVATIGPVSASADMLRSLAGAGTTMARLNGSHNTRAWHGQAIRLIKETLPGLPVLLDIPGRKIRTASLAHEPAFRAGDVMILTTDRAHDGTRKVPVDFDRFHEFMMPGFAVHADDGHLSFLVEAVSGRDVHMRATVGGALRSRKGINVPQARFTRAGDRTRPRDAGVRRGKWRGLRWHQLCGRCGACRGHSQSCGSPMRIVAKVENGEIIAASDMVMIDRGDLAVETDPDVVCLLQKRIIAAARGQQTPVIVATELLDTMIRQPYPTKAEISDITNAVLDRASLLMLSGETVIGSYPLAATA
ncbi:pyruvate kinase [Komagataeibacter xylinus]|uniref:pyruvate kinase n=1 Tax=Komagataeibacter xylinus TaxID=28448 RepID=UPI00280B62AF|nr:pyruvate kinase [Komagataeibacter xylinus]